MQKFRNWSLQTKTVLVVYLFLSICIVATGTLYYLNQKKSFKSQINNELKSNARLKSAEISNWLKERIADARVISESPIFTGSFENLINKNDSFSLHYLNQKIKIIKEAYQYENVLLVNMKREVILNALNRNTTLGDSIMGKLSQVAISKKISPSDIYYCAKCKQIHFDILAPIIGKDLEHIGYIILRVNPDNYLFPLINSWHTGSKTAETVIIKKEKDSVVFLNKTKQSKWEPLNLKINLKNKDIVAVQAIMNNDTLIHGFDYKGHEVLAYSTKISGIDWILLSKVNKFEVYEPFRKQAWIFTIIIGLLLVLMGTIILAIRRTNQRKHLNELLTKELERKALITHFEYLVKYANDIILLANEKGQIIEANNRALETYQLGSEEIRKMKLSDLGKFNMGFLKNNDASKTYETVNKRKDGKEFYVEVSENTIEIEGVNYYQAIIRDITDRKLVENKLQMSEQTLKLFVKYAPAAIAMFDRSMNYLAVSDRFITDYGLKNKDLIGKSHYQIFPEISDGWKEIHQRCLQGAIEKADEDIFPRKDGSFDYVHWEIHPWFDSSGVIGGILLFSEVITDKIQARIELRQSEEKYRLLAENINDVVWLMDIKDFHFEYVSPSVFQLRGYTPEEVLEQSADEALTPESREKVRKLLSETIEAKKSGNIFTPYAIEIEQPCKDGSIVQTEVISNIIYDEKGEPAKIIGVTRNITERKKYEKALIESEQFANAVLNGLSAHIAIVDAHGKILAVNESWRDFAEKNPPVLINVNEGSNYLETCYNSIGEGAQTAMHFAAMLKSVIVGEREHFELEYECHSPNEKRWFTARVSKFPGKGEAKAIVAHENISIQKLAEQSVIQSENLHRLLFDSNPIPMWVYDLETLKFLKVNQAAISKYGFTRSEFLNMTLKDIRPAEDAPLLIKNVQSEKSVTQESGPWRHRLKNGEVILVDIHSHEFVYDKKPARIVATYDITEKVKAHETMIKSEEHFRTLFEQASDGIFISDEFGKYIDVNEVGCQLMGYSKDEILQMTITDLISEDELFRLDSELRRNMPGQNLQTHWTFRRKDNRTFIGEVISKKLADGRIQAFVRDITEKLKAEEEIRMLNQRISSATNAARVGIWEWDIVNNILYWDDQMYKLYGTSKEEFPHAYEAWLNGVHPEDREFADQESKMALAGLTEYDTEFRVVWPDRSIHHLKAKGEVFRDENNKPIRMIGVNFDVTLLKSAVEKILQSEERYRSTLDRMMHGCQIISFDWKYIYLNEVAIFHSKLSADDLLDNRMMDVFPGIEKTDLFQVISDSMQNRKVHYLENKFDYGDGTSAWFDLSIQPIPEGVFILSVDITKRKEAEEALLSSETQLSSIFHSSPVGIMMTDFQTSEILKVNKAITQIHGYEANEMTGKNVLDLNLWFNLKQREKVMEILKKEKRISNFETKSVRKNGEVFDLMVSVELIELNGKQMLLGIEMDVTERRKILENLRISEQRLRTIAEQSLSVTWEVDANGMYTYLSPLAEKVWGYNPEDLVGKKHFYDIHPQKGRDEFKHAVFAIFRKKGDFYNLENQIIKPDGGIVWVSTNGVPQFDEYHNLTGYVGADIDITGRKLSEIEILTLNKELELRVAERTAELLDLYNNAPCGYHSLDENGYFVLVNDTELKWLGYERSELIDKTNATDLLTDDSKKVFAHNFPKFKETGNINSLELDFIRKDKRILPVLLSATMIVDDSGKFLRSRSTLIDNTDRKKAEKLIQETQEQLEMTNKELEAFAYSVSHDLRAPLRHIDGFSKILKNKLSQNLDAETTHLFEVISASSGKMGLMIEHLLNFSRLGRKEIQKTEINLDELIAKTIAQFEPDTKNRKIEWEIGQLPIISGDPQLIAMVFENLISNALKYASKRDIAKIEIATLENNQDKKTIFIKDNGAGFDQKYADKLFGVFQRLHANDEFEGIGIGLANVKRIVNKHGGQIWAEGIENEGATFYIKL